MIYCLSPHSVNCLVERYPRLMHEVFTENLPAYTFIKDEMRTDWLLKQELNRFETLAAEMEAERQNEERFRSFVSRRPGSPSLMDY